jgi:glycosyltransferase involved in cell wall biosynthesis
LTSIDANRRSFDELVDQAVSFAAAGNWEAAAIETQQAGRFAWIDHSGLFASDDLEFVLGRIRRSIPPSPKTRTREQRTPRVVAHIATQLYGAGGHTQTISRWVRQDPDSDHRLILTRQGGVEVPPKIAECFQTSTGPVFLDRRPGGLVKRAASLRRLVSDADVVVVHAHPHDVVPALALGLEGSPPAVYVNHADHVFWLGTSAASVVLNLRRSGLALCVSRRGVDPSRCIVANRPLELAPEDRRVEKQRSKCRSDWGVSDDEFLVVSAAAESKYEPIGTQSLIGLFTSFLARHPRARLLVAGPSAQGMWSEAADATGGRIKALGRLSNVPELLSAADAYVDSFPFASLTSLLEAGAHGLPLITFRGHPAECAVLGADSPGLDDELFVPSTEQEFVSALASLADFPEFRAARGAATKAAVLHGHSHSAWRDTAAAIYAKASDAVGPITTGQAPWQDGPLDQLVALVQQQTGFAGIGAAAADVVSLRKLPQRIGQWSTLRRTRQVRLSQLLPEWAYSRAAEAQRLAKLPSSQKVSTAGFGNTATRRQQRVR